MTEDYSVLRIAYGAWFRQVALHHAPFVFLVVVGVLLVGCGGQTAVTPMPVATIPILPDNQTNPALAPTRADALERPYSYTYQQPDGNRLVIGAGNLPNQTPLDIVLEGTPIWVTGVPLAQGVLWGVVLQDGRTQAFLVDAGQSTPITSNPLTAATAPVMTVDPQQGVALFLNPPSADPTGSNPVLYNATGHIAYSNPAGALSLVDGGQPFSQPPVTLLPDARILFDENGRLLFLTDPTDRYAHGVLGDAIEAGSVTLLQTSPAVQVLATIPITAPQVVEGIMPLWTDWNGDGVREIVVTVSDAAQGAQIVLFGEDGARLAQGPAVGAGNRWRHQIALAPFGPAGEMELAAVLTPHLGGVVEFYQWQGEALTVVAQLPGYSSHQIGSRNLDMAMAGDFNGDGRLELLLPTQDMNRLGGIQRTVDGAAVAYEVAIDGALATNLAGVTMSTGQTAVALGRTDNTLRIWQP